MPTEIAQSLPPGPRAVAAARRAVERLAPRVRDPDLQDLRLMVSELVTNSLRHARAGPGGPVGLRLALDGDRARAEVIDDGPGFEPDSPPGPRAHAGWGLLLVDALSESWGVETNDTTTVWFELRLGRPDARGGGDGGLSGPAATV